MSQVATTSTTTTTTTIQPKVTNQNCSAYLSWYALLSKLCSNFSVLFCRKYYKGTAGQKGDREFRIHALGGYPSYRIPLRDP
jgi:hypothetical protein